MLQGIRSSGQIDFRITAIRCTWHVRIVRIANPKPNKGRASVQLHEKYQANGDDQLLTAVKPKMQTSAKPVLAYHGDETQTIC